jgi:hypothetical protein
MPSKLYGGRSFNAYHSLSDQHVRELSQNGIGVALNLTNHYFDVKSYKESLGMLERFHAAHNSIIITNDELARNIKIDFPKYQLKASIIKNLNSLVKIEKAYLIYDYVTLPMDVNDDIAFLYRIPEKKRIILFANANCAYYCPARTCYLGFSQYNRGEKVTSRCSKSRISRVDSGPVYFDVVRLREMGFSQFKLVPLLAEKADKVTQIFSRRKGKVCKKSCRKNPDAMVISYPKSGRTWLRFILACYFNVVFELDKKVDFHNFFQILPNDTEDSGTGLPGYRYYDRQDVPLIPFSHAKQCSNGVIRKGIFLIRCPFDVMVSDYFQQTERLNLYDDSLKTFLRNEEKGVLKLCRYLNNWSEVAEKEKFLVLSYEEMSFDIHSVICNLLQYLDINVDYEALQLAISQSDFKRMQSLEKEKGFASSRYDLTNRNALRMREGKTGGYKEYLDQEDLDFLSNALTQNLNNSSKTVLIRHKCHENWL